MAFVFDTPSHENGGCIFDNGIVVVDAGPCIFDYPRHLNGGYIFDAELLEQGRVNFGGGGFSPQTYSQTPILDRRRQDDDEVVFMVINAFLELIG